MGKCIRVFDEYGKESFTYTDKMEPELVLNPGGGFDIYYKSGFEAEDGVKETSCHYNADHSYVIFDKR